MPPCDYSYRPQSFKRSGGKAWPLPCLQPGRLELLWRRNAPHRRPVFRSPIPAEAFPLRNASPFFGVAPPKLRELLTGRTSLLDSSAGRPHENARRLPSSFAHRARDPSGKGAPSWVFGPPDFLCSLSDPTPLSENRLPRKGRQRPASLVPGVPRRAPTPCAKGSRLAFPLPPASGSCCFLNCKARQGAVLHAAAS